MSAPCSTKREIFGAALRALRLNTKTSQQALASAAGMQQSGWSRVEGGRAILNWEQMQAVCAALGVADFVLLLFFDHLCKTFQARGFDVLDMPPAEAVQTGHLVISAKVVRQIAADAWDAFCELRGEELEEMVRAGIPEAPQLIQVDASTPTLDEIVAQIPPEAAPEEVCTGADVGAEIIDDDYSGEADNE